MPIELRIRSGARTGQRETFSKDTITIGRRPASDLRFDVGGDLDVSGNHAELRLMNGAWVVIDCGSTNGTFLNGTRVTGPAPITNGDVVGFGPNGPTVEVRLIGVVRPTEERIAIAVKEQTSGLRMQLILAVAVVAALGVGGYWYLRQKSATDRAEVDALLARNDSLSAQVRVATDRLGDSTLAKAFQRQNDSLRQLVVDSKGNPAKFRELQAQLEKATTAQQARMSTADHIAAQNDRGVAMLITSFGPDSAFGGTAFGVTPEGLMVTNRHNVRRNGRLASSVTVVFANTSSHLSAHIVKVSDDSSSDLATIQLDGGGRFPTVSGVSRDGDVAQGANVVTIGFPGSYDLPMEGSTMKSSLIPGTVGKKTSDDLQLDSWATQGASGSPVFDARGIVIGVIRGGQPGSNGAIVFAVPSAKVVAIIGEGGRAIVK